MVLRLGLSAANCWVSVSVVISGLFDFVFVDLDFSQVFGFVVFGFS